MSIKKTTWKTESHSRLSAVYFIALYICLLFMGCEYNTSTRTITLTHKGYYEFVYKNDTIEINSNLPSEDGSTTYVTTIGKSYLKDGEYYSCDDNNLFMSVKRDTSFVIISDLDVPEKMNVYIGLAKNAPSNIRIPKSEKIDGRYVTKYYTDEERLKYVGFEYYYDKDYTILSIRHFLDGNFTTEMK